MKSNISKFILFLLMFITCLFGLSTVSFAASHKEHKEYAKIVREMESKYGKGAFQKGSRELTGVCYLALVDMDKNGTDEMIVVYHTSKLPSFYKVKLYTFIKQEAVCVCTYKLSPSGPFVSYHLDIAKKNESTFLKIGSNPFDIETVSVSYITTKNGKKKTGFSWRWRDYAGKDAYYINGKIIWNRKEADDARESWEKGITVKTIWVSDYSKPKSYYDKLLKKTKQVRKKLKV